MRKSLIRKRIGSKGKTSSRRGRSVQAEAMHTWGELGDLEGRIALIQALIPVGLKAVQETLQQEVSTLAGGRYAERIRTPDSRQGGQPQLNRWGSQPGSVYLADQKIPIDVPRVRDRQGGGEVRLQAYQRLQQPRNLDEGLLKRIVNGLSCRNYRACAEAVPEAFGLSASTISRRTIRASERKLRQLQERSLKQYDFVSLFLDGKSFASEQIVIALGVTIQGEKVILGFLQAGTENEKVCSDFLRQLEARGLRYEDGLLCVIDGAKGLRKAIQMVFGQRAVVQRCQWHKRENVLRYLAKGKQAYFRQRLQAAYRMPSLKEAEKALLAIRKELSLLNQSAVASLEEGLDETLTLHRLGLARELGQSFSTTNCLESINAQLGQKTDKVDHWKNSNQLHRWVATALLEIEPRLRKVRGYRYLPLLRAALKASVSNTLEVQAA